MLVEPTARFTLRPLTDASDVLAHALTYAHQGLSVVLIHAPVANGCSCGRKDCPAVGKHPIDRGWQNSAPADESTLRDRFARLKFTPNLGLVLGPQLDGTYLVAVDIDVAERAAALELELGELPKTVTSASARGERMLYSLPQGTPESRVRNVTGLGGAPGVDVKAARGQIVVPPSVHASGAVYQWTQTGEVADLPAAWVLALLGPPVRPPWAAEYTPTLLKDDRRSRNRAERYLQSAVLAESGLMARCGEGLRNSTLHAALCRLLPLAHGLALPSGHGYVVRELSSGARASGLGEREVRATVASAERWLRESGAVRVLPHEAARGNGSGAPRASEPPGGNRKSSAYGSETPGGNAGHDECPPISAENNHIIPPTSEFPPGPPGGAAPALSDFFANKSFPGEFSAPDIELIQDNHQAPAKLAENVARLLERHPVWRGGPRLDTFRTCMVWPSKVPEPLAGISRNGWGDANDADALAIQGWLWSQPFAERVRASKETAWDGLILAASRNAFDSLVETVDALPEWDGVPRVDGWLTRYFGAEATEVHRRIGRSWLLASMARVYEPGCMVDVVPVLESMQRRGKNRAIDALYGRAPYVQTPIIAKVGENVELDRTASSSWCIHDDEGKLFGNREASVKGWITRTYDTYRLPWGRTQSIVPRRAVIVCSINDEEYFTDRENRRFLPIRCGELADEEGILRDREQLWAETRVAYRGGERWYYRLDDPIWEAMGVHQERRRVEDPMVDKILSILSALMPGAVPSTNSILEACQVPPERRTPELAKKVGHAFRVAGWERFKIKNQGWHYRRLPPRGDG